MLDVGFSEIIVIAVVALVVVGPERLPTVARTAGALLGRARRYVDDVKGEVQRQMDLEELRRFESGVQDAAKSLQDSVHQTGSELEAAAETMNQDIAALTHGNVEVATDSHTIVTFMEPEPSSAQLELWLEPSPAAQPSQAPQVST
jgi:sec-independent protein translocase protein TatB